MGGSRVPAEMIVEPPVDLTAIAPAYEGFVQAITGNMLEGWAFDRNRPEESISVDIYIDNVFATALPAATFGADLHWAGIGTGHHRWAIDLSELVHDDSVHLIHVRYGGTERDLTDCPRLYLRSLLDLVPDMDLLAFMATRYLRGQGIEIGALYAPLVVPPQAKTLYLDRKSTAELQAIYPRYRDRIVDVDIIDDGETLATVADNSTDYLIACSMLEHCQDPIGTLKNFLRVVRPGGVVFVTIPSSRAGVDRHRPPTPIDHLIRDHEEGPAWSRADHYLEFTRAAYPDWSPGRIETRTGRLMKINYSIHFHVFTEFEMLEILGVLKRRYGLDFVIEQVANKNSTEGIVILRKC